MTQGEHMAWTLVSVVVAAILLAGVGTFFLLLRAALIWMGVRP